MKKFKLHQGNCLDILKKMSDNSVDSIVTDPPYGLAFMGKKWDYDVPSVEIWKECLRVLKPGGHLLAFAGTRTQHRMAVRIEDAGFEIRDMLAWVYGSGFPKSMNVSKAIVNSLGAEREVVGKDKNFGVSKKEDGKNAYGDYAGAWDLTAPSSQEAKQWNGWGTALKPALEPITLARKPLIGTVADNVLTHGTGAINVGACRVEYSETNKPIPQLMQGKTKLKNVSKTMYDGQSTNKSKTVAAIGGSLEGRWPANFIHDGGEEITDILGESARFFYCAKTSKKDREEGLEDLKDSKKVFNGQSQKSTENYKKGSVENLSSTLPRKNNHPTVKPTELMRYLCRLITPPGGVVLDPFMGSGSTGKAAVLEGFNFTGIELDADYFKIAKARIEHVREEKPEPKIN